MRFISKHWGGGYSLAVSFWIIGVLLTIIEGFAYLMMAFSSIPVLVYSVFIIGPVVFVWKIVGIWRSIDLIERERGRFVWSIATRIIVAIFVIRVLYIAISLVIGS